MRFSRDKRQLPASEKRGSPYDIRETRLGRRSKPMIKTLSSLKFLFTAPLILLMLVVINWMTSPGHWWVQWAALGIGIAWVISFLRVLRAALLLGGVAALGTWFLRRF